MTTGTTEAISIQAYVARLPRELGQSRWITIDQDRIDRFADAIEDHQFIHVDPQKARSETQFGGTIAHGFLSLSLLSTMIDEIRPTFRERWISINYGLDRVRFLEPVQAGARVRGSFTMVEASKRKAGDYLLRYQVEVEVEGGKRPALVADWLAMAVVQGQQAEE